VHGRVAGDGGVVQSSISVFINKVLLASYLPVISLLPYLQIPMMDFQQASED
jgi:nucleoside recognition membrane protein YjiH